MRVSTYTDGVTAMQDENEREIIGSATYGSECSVLLYEYLILNVCNNNHKTKQSRFHTRNTKIKVTSSSAPHWVER